SRLLGEVIMGDAEKVLAECVTAQAEDREISDACARVIASWHYAGQASAGYAFVSTGTIPPDIMTEDDPSEVWYAGSEQVWRELFGDGHYESLPADGRLAADMLGTYLLKAGTRGPVAGWSRLWV